MPPKKGKKSKKATVDKSTKQTVRQSVIVNVNTKDSSKTKKKQTSNVKSFTKGMSYMAGTPYVRSFVVPPIQPHDGVSGHPVQQPIFRSDLVNRVSALENLQRSVLSDEQQARNIVTPLATQSPTAMKPIGTPNTPELMRDNSTPTVMKTPDVVKDKLNQFEENRQKDVLDIRTIMNASQGLETPPTTVPPYTNELYGDEEAQSPTRPTPVPKLELDRSPYELRNADEAGPSTSALPLADQFKEIEQKVKEKVKAKTKSKKGKDTVEEQPATVTELVPLFEQLRQEDMKKNYRRSKIPTRPKTPDDEPTK